MRKLESKNPCGERRIDNMASAKVKYVKGWFVPQTAKEREILKKAKKIYAEWIALERKSKRRKR